MLKDILKRRIDTLMTELSALALRTAEREYELMNETSPVKLSKKGVMPKSDMVTLMRIKFELTVLEGALDG